jgi:hypothetical protein
MSTQENLISKIKKLLALANNEASTQSESEKALKLANRLLIKHNLTSSDIEVSAIQSDIVESDKSQTGFGGIKEEGAWEGLLIAVLAQYNFCHSIRFTTSRVHGGTLSVIGKKENVEAVLYLFDVARAMFRRSSKQAYNSHRKNVLEENRPLGLTEKDCLSQKKMGYRMPWIRTYLKGCVIGLSSKLEQEREELKVSADVDANKFALVLVNTSTAITNFIENKHKNLKSGSGKLRVNKDHGAFKSGLATGKSANFNKGLQGASKDAIRLQA